MGTGASCWHEHHLLAVCYKIKNLHLRILQNPVGLARESARPKADHERQESYYEKIDVEGSFRASGHGGSVVVIEGVHPVRIVLADAWQQGSVSSHHG